MFYKFRRKIFSAGPSGDKRGADEVKMWTFNYFDATCQKPVQFYQAAKGINFQVGFLSWLDLFLLIIVIRLKFLLAWTTKAFL